jgi:ABC-type nitrate/sulfonate/bicarbonate transport system ATPase subunit
MENIEINIIGKSGVGKSRLSYVIEKFLKEQGFNVNIDFSDNSYEKHDYQTKEYFENCMTYELEQRLNRIKDNVEIKITNKQNL